MISAYTPPGTKVVCVEDNPNAYDPENQNVYGIGWKHLKKDNIYTVRSMFYSDIWEEVNVRLEEIEREVEYGAEGGFHRGRFRYLIDLKYFEKNKTDVEIEKQKFYEKETEHVD